MRGIKNNPVRSAVWATWLNGIIFGCKLCGYPVHWSHQWMEEMPMAEHLDADLAVLTPYLEKLGATPHRAQLITLLNWVHTTFPQLKARVAWNQPMFTDHDTFIIGFSTAKDHLNIALNHILWIAIGTRSRLLVIKQPRCYGKLLSMRQSITSYLQKSFNIIWLLNKPWRPFGALDASAFTTSLSCLNPSRERFLMLKLRLIVNALKSSWHNFNFYQLQPN